MVVETLLYDKLSVAPDASASEIKVAYRRAALRWHPDKNLNDPNAAEIFKKLQQAYEILSDPEKRRTYDSFGLQAALGDNNASDLSAQAAKAASPSMSNSNARAGFSWSGGSWQTTSSTSSFQFNWSFGQNGTRTASNFGNSSTDFFDNSWETGLRFDRMFRMMQEDMFKRTRSIFENDDMFNLSQRQPRRRQ